MRSTSTTQPGEQLADLDSIEWFRSLLVSSTEMANTVHEEDEEGTCEICDDDATWIFNQGESLGKRQESLLFRVNITRPLGYWLVNHLFSLVQVTQGGTTASIRALVDSGATSIEKQRCLTTIETSAEYETM